MPSPVQRPATEARRILAVGTLVAALSTSPAAAQVPGEPSVALPVDSGARVRVTARRAGLRKEIARVTAVWPDSIQLQPLAVPLAPPLTVPSRDLDALALSRGRSAGAGARRGALIGAAVVFLPGAALTTGFLVHDYLSDQRGRCYEWCYFGPFVFGVLTVGGTGIGAIGGALIGAAVGAEGWRPLPLPQRVSIAPIVAPSPRGFALGLTLTPRR
jgi:hypothetical protein